MLMIEKQKEEKFKIGFFTDSYRPYISGVVRSIEILTDELANMGHESYIFAPAYPSASNEQNVYRFLSIPAPTQRNFALPLPFSSRMNSTVRTLGLDIIHVHTPFLMGSLGALTARRFNLPLVFTHHTLYHSYAHYLPFGKKMATGIIKQWDINFCNRCDLIIAPSQFVKALVRRNGVRTPVSVIPTGLPDNLDKGDPHWLKEKLALSPNDKVLLYVGRMGKEKNIIFLIEAMEKIIQKRKDTRLVLVGTGPEEADLRQLSRQKNLQRFIFFTGRVSHQDLQNCYAGADIFIFASQTETQGMVVGEAKQTGLPVVALHSPCMAEMIFHGKDGFLAYNLEGFINYIFYLLNNEKVSILMGQKGKINTLRFSTRLFASKMLEAYHHAFRFKFDRKGTYVF